MDDEAIVSLYWQRNEKAIDETAKKYGGYCYTVSHNILGSCDDAEECVNDTWLHAWHAIPPQKPMKLGAFVAKITRNLSLGRIRRLSAKKRGASQAELALHELDECVPASFSVEELVETRELARAVEHFLSTLKDFERDVFMARYFHFAPTALIAERTGCSTAKINTSLCRTRSKLKKYLTEEKLC